MTNKEAIKSLQNIVEYWDMRPTEQEAARLAIKALEQQDKDRWIPVSEKPPSDDDIILYSGHYLSEEEVDSCSGEWFLDRKEYMTAWKPMPEPYEADET